MTAASTEELLVTATYAADFQGGYRATLAMSAQRSGDAHVAIDYDIEWQPARPQDGEQLEQLNAAASVWVDKCLAIFISQLRYRIQH
jgi:hypothetical protein